MKRFPLFIFSHKLVILLVNILTMIEEQYRPAILEIAEVAIKDSQLQQKEIN